jgi:hypothetical protein
MGMTDIADTARRALEILDRDGWCKRALTWCALPSALLDSMPRLSSFPDMLGNYPEGSHCIGGAVNLALRGKDRWVLTPLGQSVYEAIASAICAQYPEHTPGFPSVMFIVAWNNRPSTTEGDVRRILEKLAAG